MDWAKNQGDVAQLVEQRTENPCVGGSIPSVTTNKILMALPIRIFHFTTAISIISIPSYTEEMRDKSWGFLL